MGAKAASKASSQERVDARIAQLESELEQLHARRRELMQPHEPPLLDRTAHGAHASSDAARLMGTSLPNVRL